MVQMATYTLVHYQRESKLYNVNLRIATIPIQVYDTAGAYIYLAGRGYFWIPMVFLAEIVQTFILADFCYYYVKRWAM